MNYISIFVFNRFEVSLDPDHVVEPFMEVVLRAKTGIMVNFKERDLWKTFQDLYFCNEGYFSKTEFIQFLMNIIIFWCYRITTTWTY